MAHQPAHYQNSYQNPNIHKDLLTPVSNGGYANHGAGSPERAVLNEVHMNRESKLSGRSLKSQELLIEYLEKGLEEGKRFFKSRYIARDLGMTPKEVGTTMKILAEAYDGLRIEAWSYSKSTTWYVEQNGA